jgi:protein tyrosine/serine phosphatase
MFMRASANELIQDYTEKIIQKMIELKMDGELIRPLMEVREEYLQAALEEIDKEFGCLDDFVTGTLKADVKALREKFNTIPGW